MNVKFLFIISLIGIFFAGCTLSTSQTNNFNGDEIQTGLPRSTSTPFEVAKSVESTETAQLEVVNTTTPAISPTPLSTNTQIPITDTPSIEETPLSMEISYKCSSSGSELISTPNNDMNELAFYLKTDEENEHIEILRSNENIRVDVPKNNIGIPALSPNGQDLAFFQYDDSNLSIWATDITGTNIASYSLGNELLSQLTLPRWLDDSKIVFPLENDGDNYSWIIWEPDTNIDYRLSTTLQGAGEETERYGIFPILDPTHQLVVYPCYPCNGAEYQVKDIQSGQDMWAIDLGTNPTSTYRYSPIWSPNGEYLILTGGRSHNENGLWVYNREGELLHDIVLPDIDGVFAADAFSWSPNNELVAFRRLKSKESLGEANKTLSYLSIADGLITDLCVDFPNGNPIWSKNGELLAIYTINQDEKQSYLNIVDISNGRITEYYNGTLFHIIGWIEGFLEP